VRRRDERKLKKGLQLTTGLLYLDGHLLPQRLLLVIVPHARGVEGRRDYVSQDDLLGGIRAVRLLPHGDAAVLRGSLAKRCVRRGEHRERLRTCNVGVPDFRSWSFVHSAG
jgi:hypothetical protein